VEAGAAQRDRRVQDNQQGRERNAERSRHQALNPGRVDSFPPERSRGTSPGECRRALPSSIAVGGLPSVKCQTKIKPLTGPLPGAIDKGGIPDHSSKPKRPRGINQRAKAIVARATAEPVAAPGPLPVQNEANRPEREKRSAAVSLGRAQT
jgi:hypothetical protein